MKQMKVIKRELNIKLSVVTEESAGRLFKKIRLKFPNANIDLEICDDDFQGKSSSAGYDLHFAGMPDDGTMYQIGGTKRMAS